MPTVELTEFVTLKDIPLLETGVAYPASTGSFTPTSKMLQEIIAAQDDPHIVAPRIKIAHAENPLDAELQALLEDPTTWERDASQPALGTIQNMRLENDGQTLVGDLYGLPAWLAAILETAYPARSIEGGYWKGTANEKSYDFMLEAVALLGVVGPGCTSLADLQELFSKDGPQVQVIEMTGVRMSGAVAAQVNVEDIRRAFYEDFATGDRYWWWDREMLVDPLEFIVQDPDEGQLYRVPVDLAGDNGVDSVTFGDPEPIKVKYVPDTAKKKESSTEAERLIAPQLEGAGRVLAVNHVPPRAAEWQDRGKEIPGMPGIDIPALRERLGLTAEQLPDDATEEQINAAFSVDPPEVPEVNEEKPAEEKIEEPESVAAASGAVTVDPETLAQLQRDAAAGREARTEQVKSARESYINAAVGQGKFPPARKAHYLTLMEKDEQGTRDFIDGLPAGLVPVNEIGVAPEGGEHVAASTAYPDEWLNPQERARVQAARNGTLQPTTIVPEA